MKTLEEIKKEVINQFADGNNIILLEVTPKVLMSIMEEVAKRYALEYGQAILLEVASEAKIYIYNTKSDTYELKRAYRKGDIYIQVSREAILNTKLDLI